LKHGHPKETQTQPVSASQQGKTASNNMA